MRAFPTRIEEVTFEKLKEQAIKNKRSVNSELNVILEESLNKTK